MRKMMMIIWLVVFFIPITLLAVIADVTNEFSEAVTGRRIF